MAEQWRTVACVLVIPGGVTVVAGVVLRRLLPTGASPRYVLAVAFAAGLTLGYVLLPSWANLVPQRHWQWIPYVGAIAALVGGLSQARQLASLERVLLCGLLSLASALVLVPTWDSLLPNRSVWCLGFMAYALGLMLLTQEWVTAATTSITVAATAAGDGRGRDLDSGLRQFDIRSAWRGRHGRRGRLLDRRVSAG